MGNPTKADGARALRIEDREVANVLDAPAGMVVQTTDGVTYVVVPEDRPDADGKTGVMFLVPPTDRYRGTFPVYSQPREVAADTPIDPGDPALPSVAPDPDAPPTGSAKDILAWVGGDKARARRALDYENAGQKRKSLVDALGRIVSG